MRVLQAIIARNLLNFTRDRLRLALSVFMPVLFIFVFSFAMKPMISSLAQPLNYLIAGIIIMTVFQSALGNSTNTIDDIAMGFMKEIIVSPVPRWRISIGQVLSATIISVIQGLIVIVLGLFMGLKADAVQLLEMVGVMVTVGVTFSSMGLYLATLAKNNTAYQGLIMVLMMPLSFLSGAYIPTTVLPKVIKSLVYINPLTYTTSIFRYITLGMQGLSSEALVKAGVAFKVGNTTIGPLMGLLIIVVMGSVFFALCVAKFNRADFSQVKTFDPHRH